MILFEGDSSHETKTSAPALAKKLDARLVGNLSPDAMSRLRVKDLKEIMLLAHANPRSFGDYDSPEEFVRQFKKSFLSQFGERDMLQVEHIYLLGCEVGLVNRKGQSFAQKVAEQLYDAGFTNVKVHAVRSPKDKVCKSLTVEVVSNAGSGGMSIQNHVEAGDVIAYENDNKSEPFLRTDDIRAELNKEHNIFHHPKVVLVNDHSKQEALQKIAARITKIEESLVNLQRFEKANDKKQKKSRAKKIKDAAKQGFQFIKAEIVDVATQRDRKEREIKILKELQNNISSERVDHWSIHLPKAIDQATALHKRTSITDDVSKGKTVSLLVDLENKYRGQRPAKIERPALIVSVTDFLNSKKSTTPVDTTPKTTDSTAPKQSGTYGDKLNRLNAAKQAITQYIDELKKEVSRNCPISFFGHLGKYKLSKFEELSRRLEGANTLDEDGWKDKIKDVYNNSTFISWGTSNRAVNLMQNILSDNSGNGVKAPVGQVDPDLFSPKLKRS